ncbi:MAG: alanine:cation symporter family protein [Clostridia bacterium]|nr:alanine:cation symporter family protein [Clostridia bacterium]
MTFIDQCTAATDGIVDVLYSYILIALLVGAGLYFTFRSRFAQIRLLGAQIRSVTEKPKDKKSVSSFQALIVSTASRVGTGNIIGVAAAICTGGFGSVFWMWLIAIVGAASAFVESTLAQIYKRRGPDGKFYGGPAYYIETALKCRPLAIIFSVLLIFTYGIGFNMLASYNLQSTFETYRFYQEHPTITPWLIGLAVAVLVAFCLFGGGKRLVKTTTLLVPVMGIAYIAVALCVVLMNLPMLPEVFRRIFTEAFDMQAIFGGFAGSCIMLGIKRGLFSNEAGVGSAPNASASADVSHPAKQGLVQMLSVFIDTLLVCSATAFMCMCSGVDPTQFEKGAPYVQAAMKATLGDFGPIFITVAMVLFAFTTLLGNLYYVDQCIFHILRRKPGRAFHIVYYTLASAIILLGAGLNSTLLWNIADISMGAMALINIPVILLLCRHAFRALRDYEKQKKQGLDPVFRAKDIDLPHNVDCWR